MFGVGLRMTFSDVVAPLNSPECACTHNVSACYNAPIVGTVGSLRVLVVEDDDLLRIAIAADAVNWEGGNSGTWWVGYSSPQPIGAGTWEIELYLDNELTGTMSVQVF